MLDTAQIPEEILNDLIKRGHTLEEVKAMTPQKAFSEYCAWNGLIGWGNTLWNAVQQLKSAER